MRTFSLARAFATLVAIAVSVACAGPAETRGLSVVAPTTLGEGHGDGHPVRQNGVGVPGPSASLPARAPGPDGAKPGSDVQQPSEHGGQPDPAPLVTPHQWDLTLHYAKGKISLDRSKAVELTTAISTPRRVGRFAVELWVGRELVDRVRFDFPLLGADWPPGADRRPTKGAPRFSPGADTVSTVRVPASDRATSAQVVDRLSGEVTPLSWPPLSPAPAPAPTPSGP